VNTDAKAPQFSKDPRVERSLRHSIWDGVFFSSMVGAAETYFSAFGVFLKATTAQIGVLASLPPLLASFAQLLSAWLGRRTGHRRQIIVWGAILQTVTLFPLALLPLAFPEYGATALIICAIVYFFGPNLGGPQWGSLLGDLVPEARRGRFFALRTQLSSLASFTSLIVAGLVLEAFDQNGLTYGGFLTIFGVAAGLRIVSAYHLSQMYDPPGHVAALEAPWHRDLWQGLRETDLLRFSGFNACMQFAVAIASPFFTLYMLRDLGFSYVEFMINTAASVCVQFLTLNRWGRLSDLFGNRIILFTTGCIIPFMPLLWLVSTNFYYLLGVQAVSGLLWAGFSLSASNTVFDLTPPNRRATLMAVHSVLAATAVFIGASIGGYLGTHLPSEVAISERTFAWATPLYGVFVLSALARMLVAATFLPRLEEVRRVRPMSASGLIFRVTRLHPISGIVFEIVGKLRRDD
jgi:MFS family permease